MVSRESARRLEAVLQAAMAHAATRENDERATPTIVDFEGVEGVAPSFLDELLTIFESFVGTEADCEPCLIVASFPARLSLKFEAVARGHGMSVQALADGSWVLKGAPNSCQ